MKTNKKLNHISPGAMPSAVPLKVWLNSVYSYNKNLVKNIPSADNLACKLISIYFTIKSKIDDKTKVKSLLMKKKQTLTINNIFSSKPEIKHNSNCVNITVYIYNKKAKTLAALAVYIARFLENGNTRNLSKLREKYKANENNGKTRLNNNKNLRNGRGPRPLNLLKLNINSRKALYKKTFIENKRKDIITLKQFVLTCKARIKYYLKELPVKVNKPLFINKPYSSLRLKTMFASDLSFYLKNKGLKSKTVARRRNNKISSILPYIFSFLNKNYKTNMHILVNSVYNNNTKNGWLKYKKTFLKALISLRKSNSLSFYRLNTLYSKSNSLGISTRNLRGINKPKNMETKKTIDSNVSFQASKYLIKKLNKASILGKSKHYTTIGRGLTSFKKKVKLLFSCFKRKNLGISKINLFLGKTKSAKVLQTNLVNLALTNYIPAKHLKTLNKVDKLFEFNWGENSKTRNASPVTSFSLEKYKLNLVKDVLAKDILYLSNVHSTVNTNIIFKSWFINSLCNIISKIYNKKVIFNIVSLKYIYLNSDILVKTLSNKLMLNKKRIKVVNVLKKIKLAIAKAKINDYTYNTDSFEYKYIEKFNTKSLNLYDKLFSDKNISINPKPRHSKSLHNGIISQAYGKPAVISYLSKYKGQGSLGKLNPMLSNTINLLKFKYVFGVKLLLKGKFPNTKASARSAMKSRYIGNLKYNSIINRSNSVFITKNNQLSNVQYTRTSNSTQIGLFGVKGWINNN